MPAIKCILCSLPLGEASQEVENIVCLFCIDERNHFRGIFSGEVNGIGAAWDAYWDSFRRWTDWRDRTFYLHQKREEQMKEFEAFVNELKYKCDKELEENEP